MPNSLAALVIALTMVAPLPAHAAEKSTVIPVTHDRDRRSYDWAARHAAILELNKTRQPKVVLIGDSITHHWGGEPRMGKVTGARSWARYLEPRSAANLGFGWDMTQNVLWRLRNGELDGLRPKAVILLIGTNNLKEDPVPDILMGIEAIIGEIRQRCPGAKVLVLALPRGKPDDPLRAKAADLARALVSGKFGDKALDLSHLFLLPDGSIPRDRMADLLHPTEKGYEMIGAEIDRQLAAWGI